MVQAATIIKEAGLWLLQRGTGGSVAALTRAGPAQRRGRAAGGGALTMGGLRLAAGSRLGGGRDGVADKGGAAGIRPKASIYIEAAQPAGAER